MTRRNAGYDTCHQWPLARIFLLRIDKNEPFWSVVCLHVKSPHCYNYMKHYCLLFLLAITACHQQHHPVEAGAAPIPVQVTTVKSSDQPLVLSLSGNAEAAHTTALGFQVAGRVNAVNVEEGSPVKKGQLLASLDPADYALGVDIAQANVDKVSDEYRRLTIMHNRGSLTDADYQKIVSGLAEVKARYALAAKNLHDTKLYAPASGVIARKSLEPGQVVGQGMPVLFMVNMQPARISLGVPEGELAQVKQGQDVSVYLSALDATFTGKVAQIGVMADATTRAYAVKVDIPNPHNLIKPGMVAQASLRTQKVVPMQLLPATALLHDADQSNAYVFVVDPQKHQAFKRTVTVDNLQDNSLRISSGLRNGELVVTGGQQKLNDASPVAIQNTAL